MRMNANAVSGKRAPLGRILDIIAEYACIAVLAVAILSASVLAPKFFTSLNLLNVLKQSSVLAVLAIGMGFVLISGCMDLTVGVNMAACALISMCLQGAIGVVPAILVALAAGVAISSFNILVIYITKARAIEIMMITFGLKMAYRGLLQAVTGNRTFREQTADFFRFLGKGSVGPIPLIVILMLVIVAVLGIVLGKLRLGRKIACVGINPEASRLSGISVIKTRVKCFLVSGICCAIAGILLASRTSAVNALSGDNYEMEAMCGLVIGGFAVFGGFGSGWRAIVGVFVYSIIKNVMNLMGMDAYAQELARGLLVILAVGVDVYLRNKRIGGRA